MAEEHFFQTPISVPELDPAFKRDALSFANAFECILTIDGKPQGFMISELTEDQLRLEAKRIATISSRQRREREIFDLIGANLVSILKAQEIVRAFLAHDDALQGLFQFLSQVEAYRMRAPETPQSDGPQSGNS